MTAETVDWFEQQVGHVCNAIVFLPAYTCCMNLLDQTLAGYAVQGSVYINFKLLGHEAGAPWGLVHITLDAVDASRIA